MADYFPELNDAADAAVRSIVKAGENSNAEDAALDVKFHVGAMQDNTEETLAANKAAGKKATYRDVPYIRIQRRGEKDFIDRPVWIEEFNRFADNHRWPEKWRRFQAGIPDDDFDGGTRLLGLPFISPAMAAELAHERIFTVEQLAVIPDVTMQHVTLGGSQLKEKAKQYLALKKGEMPNEQLALVQGQLEEMKARMAEMQKAQKSSK